MAGKKHYSVEQAVTTMRQIEAEVGTGTNIAEACKKAGISNQTYYKWRNTYGSMKVDEAKRFKELEKETVRLKKIIADLSIDNQILKEYNKELSSGKY